MKEILTTLTSNWLLFAIVIAGATALIVFAMRSGRELSFGDFLKLGPKPVAAGGKLPSEEKPADDKRAVQLGFVPTVIVLLRSPGRDYAYALSNKASELRFLIGRSTECDVMLSDALASRLHAALTIRTVLPGQTNAPRSTPQLPASQTRDKIAIEVTDLKSRHGTRVNNRRISRKQLKPGDKISVAQTTIEIVACSDWDPGESPV